MHVPAVIAVGNFRCARACADVSRPDGLDAPALPAATPRFHKPREKHRERHAFAVSQRDGQHLPASAEPSQRGVKKLRALGSLLQRTHGARPDVAALQKPTPPCARNAVLPPYFHVRVGAFIVLQDGPATATPLTLRGREVARTGAQCIGRLPCARCGITFNPGRHETPSLRSWPRGGLSPSRGFFYALSGSRVQFSTFCCTCAQCQKLPLSRGQGAHGPET